MLSAKDLLLKQTAEAFDGRPDMSLKAALSGITQDEASWRPDETVPTIEQIVRHVAWAKSSFCQRGFGSAMPLIDKSVNDTGDTPGLPVEFPCGAAWGLIEASGIDQALGLLDTSQKIVTQSLESCSDDALEKPIPTHHGKSAAHFFWIMLMHDIYHAGQIRTRRSLRAATLRQS